MSAPEDFTDPLMLACEQARAALKQAMKHCHAAQALCDHRIVLSELDHAEAAIDSAEGRIMNAWGCQAGRIEETDPDEW